MYEIATYKTKVKEDIIVQIQCMVSFVYTHTILKTKTVAKT